MDKEINEVNSFETLSLESIISTFDTDVSKGLTNDEAQARLNKYGENKLHEKPKDSWIKIFFNQMNNPTIFVLFGAIILTIGISIFETINAGYFDFLNIGDWPDVVIILAVIIMNSIIGTVQEIKAQSSLDALKKMSSPESLVIRNGERIKIKSSQLVPGDIVILEEGDTIGADIRLIESYNLKVNESSLTGESVPVEKDANVLFTQEVGIGDRINMLYMSTPVVYGRGAGVVVSTGMNTEIGKIAEALDIEEEETPLQKVLAKLSKTLGLLTFIVVAAVLVVDIIWIFAEHTQSSIDAWIDAVLSSIALAVAAIPEGLPAVVTIVLSIGVQKMVKVNTIVRKLQSVETLGAVSIVCSDKTGTLTQNKMTVLESYTINKYYTQEDFVENSNNESLVELARGMSLCSNASVDDGVYGDPTEIALVVMANQFGMKKSLLNDSYPRVDELPFDSVRKMMSTMNNHDGNTIVYTKGALDSILENTNRILDNSVVRDITKEDIDKINEANGYFASKALRVLALAYDNKDSIVENDLIFVGLVAMIDPARPEAKPAVKMFKEAGITTVMITGDHKDTAFAIAKELGIVDKKENCLMGKDVDNMSEEELIKACETVRVFSRVSPQNKVDIVKAFKASGHICAMTGDGVNDAPSLKTSDIGIAMGITGTDVSKEASDMILTDDNFASIEKAVEEGRGIYANIKKTVIFLISSNIAEVLGMFFIVLLGLPAPFIAIHLLWINLITDSLPAISLGMDPKDPDNMKEKPRDPNEGIFANGGMFVTILYGAILSIGVLIGYFSCAFLNGAYTYEAIKTLYQDPEYLLQAQTMAFTSLAFMELFHMIGMSNVDASCIKVFKNKNYMMLIAFIVGVVLQLAVIEIAPISKIFSTHNLTLVEWIITIAISIFPLIMHEIIYLIRKKIKKNKKIKENLE